MSPTTRKTFVLSLVPACFAMLVIQACGGSSDAVAQASPAANDAAEGAWESAVTIRDCTSGAVVRTFKGLTAIHRGGSSTALNSQSPASFGTAVGTWKREANGSLTLSYRFFRFNPADGSHIGQQRLVRTLTPGTDASSMTGTIAAQILDLNDNIVQTLCGTEVATRLP